MLKSILKPESAVTTGVLEAIGIYLIYNNDLPSSIDVLASPAHDPMVESTRKKSATESAILLAAVFAITRDFNAFIIGGLALIAVDAHYKHANAVNPGTGKVDMGGSGQSIAPSTESQSYALPDYDSMSG